MLTFYTSWLMQILSIDTVCKQHYECLNIHEWRTVVHKRLVSMRNISHIEIMTLFIFHFDIDVLRTTGSSVLFLGTFGLMWHDTTRRLWGEGAVVLGTRALLADLLGDV